MTSSGTGVLLQQSKHSNQYEVRMLLIFGSFDFNVPGISLNLTSAAGCRFRNINMPHIGLRDKYLIGEQGSGNGAGIRCNKNLGSIRAVKLDVSGASPERECVCGNDMCQGHTAGTSGGYDVFACNIGQRYFTCGHLNGNIISAGYIRDGYPACGSGKRKRISGHIFYMDTAG